MKNESVRRLGEGNFEQDKDVQKVEVKRMLRVNPVFIRTFVIAPYLRNKPQPHYNSANSGLNYRLDYRA